MIDFNVSIEGMGEFNALMNRVDRMMRGPFDKDPARAIRQAYIDRIDEAFNSRGQTVGGWAPLTPAYARRKQRAYPGRPLLVATGEMRQALTRPNHRFFLFDRRPSRMTLGSKDPVSPYHQSGTDDMPERPLFENDEDWSTEVAEIVTEHWFGSALERALSIL